MKFRSWSSDCRASDLSSSLLCCSPRRPSSVRRAKTLRRFHESVERSQLPARNFPNRAAIMKSFCCASVLVILAALDLSGGDPVGSDSTRLSPAAANGGQHHDTEEVSAPRKSSKFSSPCSSELDMVTVPPRVLEDLAAPAKMHFGSLGDYSCCAKMRLTGVHFFQR